MVSGNVKKFELKLERTGVIVVVVGMTILVCLSFILGVGVGKNIDAYPGKISSFPKRVLALFWRPAKLTPEQPVVESKEVQTDKGNMDLAFHKALTSEKLPSIQPAPPVEIQPQALPETPSPIEAPETNDLAKKEETTTAKVRPAEKTPVENKSKVISAPAPAASAGPAYLIHVTSLKDKAKAGQINKTIVSMGYTSKIVKVELKGKGTWYRVIVTGFESKAKAQAAAGRISKKVTATCAVWPVGGDAARNP